MAIGLGQRRGPGPGGAAGAGPVVDDDALAERRPRCCASSRAITSLGEPGVNGTIRRIVRDG